MKHLAEKREHECEVAQKAVEEHNNFVRLAKERLEQRMEANKEKRQAHISVMLGCLQDKVTLETFLPHVTCFCFSFCFDFVSSFESQIYFTHTLRTDMQIWNTELTSISFCFSLSGQALSGGEGKQGEEWVKGDEARRDKGMKGKPMEPFREIIVSFVIKSDVKSQVSASECTILIFTTVNQE